MRPASPVASVRAAGSSGPTGRPSASTHQVRGPRVRHRGQHRAERRRRRDHDALRDRPGDDVEQRGARVRRLARLQHGQPPAAVRPGGPRLPPPRETGERDELLPVPHVDPAHTARPARAEHLQPGGRVGEPPLPGQHRLGARAVDGGRGDDRVPPLPRVLFGHGRQADEVGDGRRGRVELGHPARVERRALAGEREQRPEPFGLVALDALPRPVQPRHVVHQRGAHRAEVRRAQTVVGRLRVDVGHGDQCAVRSRRTAGCSG